jgi:FkbM family methyltransferase
MASGRNASLAARALGDAWAVCRTAHPRTTARWLASLAMHLPACTRSRSLTPADRAWARAGARFRAPGGVAISLPGPYTSGAREMFCRNVYLRTGLVMPAGGWVMDLGANRGLFSVWAALAGAQVVAVEAQQGFAGEISSLAAHNGVAGRVHIETRLVSGSADAHTGVLADPNRWAGASHATAAPPQRVSIPELMSAYAIPRAGLLKMDIEGSEFAVFDGGDDLAWLDRVDQLALEIHPEFGDAAELVARLVKHGFMVAQQDNDGNDVGVDSARITYAYGRRD